MTTADNWQQIALASAQEAFGTDVSVHSQMRPRGGYAAWAERGDDILAIGGGKTQAAAWRMLSAMSCSMWTSNLTTRQVADVLGYANDSWVRQRIMSGELVPVRVGSRRVPALFSPKSVHALLGTRKNEQTRDTVSRS